jgi:hypothetical protein
MKKTLIAVSLLAPGVIDAGCPLTTATWNHSGGQFGADYIDWTFEYWTSAWGGGPSNPPFYMRGSNVGIDCSGSQITTDNTPWTLTTSLSKHGVWDNWDWHNGQSEVKGSPAGFAWAKAS